MGEEFILVSKEKIKNYENKIKELESRLFDKQDLDDNIIAKNIITQLDSLFNKHNSSLTSELKVIIEKNNKHFATQILEKTSNANILENTQLNQKLELIPSIEKKLNLVHSDLKINHKDTIENLKLLVEHLQDSNTLEHIRKGVEEIREYISHSLSSSNEFLEGQFSNHLEIIEKLQEIELFMTNLRILLSYVKPKYIQREQ
ncbi:MAG: hypothetical protein ACMXYB_05530 [Candidatus Woesearchaeota archaeon]